MTKEPKTETGEEQNTQKKFTGVDERTKFYDGHITTEEVERHRV